MTTVDHYHHWVEWSDADQAYIGKCPDLITGIHGPDPAALYPQLREVIADVIAEFQNAGRPLPPPSTRPMMEVA